MNNSAKPHICVVAGSQRQNSQSEKVGRFLQKLLNQCELAQTSFVTLAQNPLPLFDESFFDDEQGIWKEKWEPISQQLSKADGYFFVVPEWGGMVPAGFKNLLLLCTKNELAHKPACLVSVTIGLQGGAYPISELRMSGYKNTHVCYTPEHLIIRDSSRVLNGPAPESPQDEAIRARIGYASRVLVEYAKAFQAIRTSGVLNYTDYPYGM